MTPEELAGSVTGEPSPPVTVHGAEPALAGPFLVGTAAAACVGATTAALAGYHAERGGEPGAVSVDLAHAAESFRSERHLRILGAEPEPLWSGVSGLYRCADGWVRVHGNYPHHSVAALRALGAGDAERMTAVIAGMPAVAVEEAVLAEGGAAAALRSRADWLAHEQGRALAGEPLVGFDRLGPAPARSEPAGARPLSGIRVLDLTHVIAGPVCGRVLAAHGAEVLRIDAEHLPAVHTLVVDTGFGKRSANLDLRTDPGRARLRELVADADVLVQSYRPGSLAAKGFGARELAELRPGLVTVELDAYGWRGPWARRRGFDSLVQLASGIAHEGAVAAGEDKPRPLPAQALDHATGWLAALGAVTALRRRARGGGTWRVRLSLARTGQWLDGLGRKETEAGDAEIARYLTETDSPFGRLAHLRIPGVLSGCPPYWAHGPRPRGADPAEWS
ncbi:CoA transferase [Sciscionella marina]|uniref:CoA transferase n=1 Tax=Sciscionella marina TaxID=508770 RepID=UPI00035CF37A|nr:CoA transferase [Sciscionella marina]